MNRAKLAKKFDAAKYDAAALTLASGDWASFVAGIRTLSESEQLTRLRMRLRWRLDEFAQHVMGPMLAALGPLSRPNDLDAAVYGPPPHRVGHRPGTTQLLVMTGRGVGKTTRQKIRAFHGLLYGLRRVSVTIAQTDPDAMGWIDNIRGWATESGPLLARLFPEMQVAGDKHSIAIRTRFGVGHLLARGWTASMRGLNIRGVRPDALDLDDVESEDSSRTKESRDATQARLTGKVLPLVPLEGGAEVIWTQTPVHADAVAARAYRGDDELRGWDVRLIPVLTAWPDRSDLWQQAAAIYFDRDARPEKGDRIDATRAFYVANRAAMDAGAAVLDPQRMGPLACHMKMWDVGMSAFRREFLMSTQGAGAVFDSTAWPRHTVTEGGMIVKADGRLVPLIRAKITAHLDTSDGGDPGALVVVADVDGTLYELASAIWMGTSISRQIQAAPAVIAPFVRLGLIELTWEPPPGAASIVEEALLAALRAAGVHVRLTAWPSKESKEDRIVGTLEPVTASGSLSVRRDLDPAATSQADAFDPRRRNNTDDWLDALQRCVERLRSVGSATTADLLDQLGL
jgi:hypothetical protein